MCLHCCYCIQPNIKQLHRGILIFWVNPLSGHASILISKKGGREKKKKKIFLFFAAVVNSRGLALLAVNEILGRSESRRRGVAVSPLSVIFIG